MTQALALLLFFGALEAVAAPSSGAIFGESTADT
jgi:hypothetical protein